MDQYQRIANIAPVKHVLNRAGLPVPTRLSRQHGINRLPDGNCLLGSARDGYAMNTIPQLIGHYSGLFLHRAEGFSFWPNANRVTPWPWGSTPDSIDCLVFDATGIGCTQDIGSLWAFFKTHVRQIAEQAKLLVIARPLDSSLTLEAFTAQSAIEGFVRSFAKELKNGATLQCIRVPESSVAHLRTTLDYFLSPASAYVTGQVIECAPSQWDEAISDSAPLNNKSILITGAAGSIGTATAHLLAERGAKIVGMDHPHQEAILANTLAPIGGIPIAVDFNGPATNISHCIDGLKSESIEFDGVVHCVGLTRDKTLRRMSKHQWDQVMQVNLEMPSTINQWLLDHAMIRDNGRIIMLSSVSGIAGNYGQTNYSTAKSGLIGYIRHLSESLASKGISVNAIAPGFIETPMTDAMPRAIREVARRLNTLLQGGHPSDVAEAIGWLIHPHSTGITGQTLRVCGQSIIGA